MKERWFLRIVWLLSLAPLWAMLTFYSFVLRARLVLGRWPYPYHPDPKSLGFDLHRYAILLSIPLTGSCVFTLFLVLVIFGKDLRPAGGRPWQAAIVCTMLFMQWILLLSADPGDFVEWFMD